VATRASPKSDAQHHVGIEDVQERGRAFPPGYDVDHVIDLQLGGKYSLSNMLPLSSSVNHSLGAQIMHAIKEAENGTPITGVGIR
jgi:hypothetical protein